jgi:hypothetical protein
VKEFRCPSHGLLAGAPDGATVTCACGWSSAPSRPQLFAAEVLEPFERRLQSAQVCGCGPLSSLPHTCADCGAHVKQGEVPSLREHRALCPNMPLRMLGDLDPARLARHVHLYGEEGAGPWLHQLDRGGPARAVTAAIRRRSRSPRSDRFVKRA